MSESQTPAQDQRCQSGPSAKNLFETQRDQLLLQEQLSEQHRDLREGYMKSQ